MILYIERVLCLLAFLSCSYFSCLLLLNWLIIADKECNRGNTQLPPSWGMDWNAMLWSSPKLACIPRQGKRFPLLSALQGFLFLLLFGGRRGTRTLRSILQILCYLQPTPRSFIHVICKLFIAHGPTNITTEFKREGKWSNTKFRLRKV